MNKFTIICFMLLLNSLPSFANESESAALTLNPDEIEITEASDEQEETSLTIKEIKNYLKTNDTKSMCLDDYLKRRTQLIRKLALAPVGAVVLGAGSVYLGGAAGVAAAKLAKAKDWSALGYIILGAGGGLVLSSTYTLYDMTKSTMEIVDNNLMIKALAEQYMNVNGEKSEKLYKKYTKKNLSPLDRNTFYERLVALDQSGELCDGSMTKKPKIKLGKDLKYKLARSKDLAKKI